MIMSHYQPFDQLDYTPLYGTIDVHAGDCVFLVEVSVWQGRALEDAGIPVCWIYASCPYWVDRVGLTRPWFFIQRLYSWPSRRLFK